MSLALVTVLLGDRPATVREQASMFTRSCDSLGNRPACSLALVTV